MKQNLLVWSTSSAFGLGLEGVLLGEEGLEAAGGIGGEGWRAAEGGEARWRGHRYAYWFCGEDHDGAPFTLYGVTKVVTGVTKAVTGEESLTMWPEPRWGSQGRGATAQGMAMERLSLVFEPGRGAGGVVERAVGNGPLHAGEPVKWSIALRSASFGGSS